MTTTLIDPQTSLENPTKKPRRPKKGAAERPQPRIRSAARASRRTKAQRALDRALAERIAADPIEFMHNPEFELPDAAEKILADAHSAPVQTAPTGVRGERIPAGLPGYLASLYQTRLLTAAEEVDLFRRMNFLKFRALRGRERLDFADPDPWELEAIEDDLAAANRIRNHIIQANLRLVVSIAKRYVDDANSFAELVSDGNVSLMRAVAKFNYALGYRFSTYATWAIRKNFNRSTAMARKTRYRFGSAADDTLNSVEDAPTGASLSQTQRLRTALDGILGRLPDRERAIVVARFGLGDGDHPHTLKEIAGELGVCKERVRQLELRALNKLRELAAEDRLEPPEA